MPNRTGVVALIGRFPVVGNVGYLTILDEASKQSSGKIRFAL